MQGQNTVFTTEGLGRGRLSSEVLAPGELMLITRAQPSELQRNWKSPSHSGNLPTALKSQTTHPEEMQLGQQASPLGGK